MTSRREFFLASGATLAAALMSTVEKAAAIEPDAGTSYLDAEHIVVLMQENRSFDHVYGALRGVRGFNDPRAVTHTDGTPVFVQKNAKGEAYVPFRLKLRESNATWLGSLPHSWRDQTDACANGNNDGWLEAKKSGRKECVDKPLTMGYYDRSDLPFYYALADAFTVCDQHFCSSLTGTTPNRLHLWTGTIRETQDANSPANVRNSDVTYSALARWKTFPERLEAAGISWKIYQNELSVPTGLNDEEDAWLSNFTDNPIEWFEQYGVFYAPAFQRYAKEAVNNPKLKPRERALLKTALEKYSGPMPEVMKPLHEKAFTVNSGDPNYRSLEMLKYQDGELPVPKGDVLYQFRKDVAEGKLPAVSWVVPPERFSDHPGAPWYGAWMLSEVIRILTEKPEVWKKTIFILTYDENDGYFDHVPPFRCPDPARPDSGKVTDGIDAAAEYWPLEKDRAKHSAAEARGGPIGLGFRVPMVIASPWTRGGKVCSEVLDHTSVLRLMEKVLTHRTGKPIVETNISKWRRVVCGDMTSAFQPLANASNSTLEYSGRDAIIEGIHKARLKPLPEGYVQVTPANYKAAMPKQEKGTRPSVALPYELHATGKVADGQLAIQLKVGPKSGAPFHAYAPKGFGGSAVTRTRSYAVEAGKALEDTWALDKFAGEGYGLAICGPNGWLREFWGTGREPALELATEYLTAKGDLALVVTNASSEPVEITLLEASYKLAAGKSRKILVQASKSACWYDFTVRLKGHEKFARRFAGRVETGRIGLSDPAMA